MHEQTIAKKIIEEATKQASAHGRIKKVTVECGALAHLPAKDMEKVLKEMAPFEVDVVEKKAKVKCKNCGFEGEPRIEMHTHDVSVFFCGKCGSVPDVIDGKDIIIKSVVIEKGN